ncbi:hypothetical protein ZWY2020_007822 [Hordeum vulgare]|nr:hypothetical protein ZWY2020_007822 [Hordeum vulgare]
MRNCDISAGYMRIPKRVVERIEKKTGTLEEEGQLLLVNDVDAYVDGRYKKLTDERLVGGCDWFKWFDEPTTPFLRQILVDLRDAVNNLRGENTRLREVNADLEQGIEERSSQMDALQNVLLAVPDNLGQTKNLLKQKTKQHQRMLFIVVLIVIFLIISIKLAA